MNEDKIIDQSELAQSVGDNIKYNFFDHVLVKPLDPIKVKKEFSKPVSTGTPVKDANGVEAQDFDNVETEVKEVDSDYLKGVVIKLPMFFYNTSGNENNLYVKEINVGDIVIFRASAGIHFDLIKNSRLLRMYDILGVEK